MKKLVIAVFFTCIFIQSSNAQKFSIGLNSGIFLYRQQRLSVGFEDLPEVQQDRYKLSSSYGFNIHCQFSRSRWGINGAINSIRLVNTFDYKGFNTMLAPSDHAALPVWELTEQLIEYSLGYTYKFSFNPNHHFFIENGFMYSKGRGSNINDGSAHVFGDRLFLSGLNKDILYYRNLFGNVGNGQIFQTYIGIGYKWHISESIYLQAQARMIIAFNTFNSFYYDSYIEDAATREKIFSNYYQLMITGNMLNFGLSAAYSF